MNTDILSNIILPAVSVVITLAILTVAFIAIERRTFKKMGTR